MIAPTTATRRQFLRDAGTATAGLVGLGLVKPGTTWARRTGGRVPTVAVFGGGVAGLTAAHELAKRGFHVTLYEARAWGGKARSTTVPDSAQGGRRPLPGEHGFRVEFGFYRNLPDTLRRIPFESNANGVLDNLVPGAQVSFARAGKRDLVLPLESADARPYTPQQVIDLLIGVLLETDLPPQAVAHFASRMAMFLSSCDARRVGQWERKTWTDFIGADRYSADYRTLLALPFTQFTQASKPEGTSAKFAGRLLELVIYTTLGQATGAPLFQVFDRPTNEAWIDPWITLLQRLGVRLRLGWAVEKLEVQDGRIANARVRGTAGARRIQADWYVCALPVERARHLFGGAVERADPRLASMRKLNTAWMNGIQFYLREPTPIIKGHVVYLDSPWAVESISQAQFWPTELSRTYGDGATRDCLSAIVADWTRPGIVYGKPARDCAPDEIAREVWEQMKRHVNDAGQTQLDDASVLAWQIDPGLRWRHGRPVNQDPLVLPQAGSWENLPRSETAIPNLVLAGDYLQCDWEVANMEAANCNAKTAANAILRRSGSRETPCAVSDAYRPPEWEPLKRLDEDRYRRGEANLFDGSGSTPAIRELADATAGDLARRIAAVGQAAGL